MDELKLRVTDFNKAELNRLVGMIPQTDPTSHEYGTLLESIERYVYFANIVAAIQDFCEGVVPQIEEETQSEVPDNIIQFAPPTGEADKFEEQVTTDKIADAGVTYDDVALDPAVVKSVITKARAEKKIGSIKEWINTNFGVDGFSAIPAKQYPQVMAKLSELGVS